MAAAVALRDLRPGAAGARYRWHSQPVDSSGTKQVRSALRRVPTGDVAPTIKARRSVAVLGFKNLSGKPDEAWISTALAEMLSTELAAGEQVRTIPGENIARMKVDLALADADSFGQDSLTKIRNHLGTDLVVVGSYLAMGKAGGNKIRLDFRLQDAVAGETIASVSETGTENELLDLVSRSGTEIRRKLGIGQVSDSDSFRSSRFPARQWRKRPGSTPRDWPSCRS